MFEPSRLKGLLLAMVGVALAMAVLGLVSHAAVGGRPSWLAGGDSTIEAGQEAIVGGRIGGVVAQARAAKVDISDLGVILGSSAVSMGIDPTLLEAEAGPEVPARWLSLYANGANIEDLHGLSELLFRDDLHPKLLVLAIHPGLLARSDDYLTDASRLDFGPFRERLKVKELMGAKVELATVSAIPLNWAFPNRTRISNKVRGLVAGVKRRAFAALGMGAESLFTPVRDPWKVRPLIPDSAKQTVEAEGRKASVRDQAEGPMRERPGGQVKDKGWYQRGSYSSEGANARALVDIIRRARGRKIEVAIMFLPEKSSLRESVPPEAMRCFREALDRNFGDDAPPAIDLRDALPDRLFYDSIHPRKESRPLMARLLADGLRAHRTTPRPR